MPVLLLALALLLTACRSGATGGAAVGAPGTPAVRAPAAPGVATFSYAPGTYRYALTNTATIALAGDSVPAESLSTTAYLTYTLRPGAAGLAVTGTVDSFAVASGVRIPRPPAASPTPITFQAELGPDGAFEGFRSEQLGAGCDSPVDALLLTARDLLPMVPGPLAPGTEWRDTTTATVCRGGIPVTSTAVQHYTVDGEDVLDGARVVRIRRTSEVTITGAGEQRSRPVTLTGTGNAESTLYVAPANGRFVGGTAEYTANLTFQTGGQQQMFVQRVRQRIRAL